MPFTNEYIPSVEQETSAFLKKARDILHTGSSKFDMWTVDRDHDMVLFRRGGGHSIESKDEDYWSFLTLDKEYCCDTNFVSKPETKQTGLAITQSISFRGTPADAPSAATISCIKDALREYHRRHLFQLNYHNKCDLTLIDARTGKEI